MTTPYVLAARDGRRDTVVDFGPVDVGGERIVVIAGPCAVESLDQCRAIASLVADAGARMFRGGAFKPRTSPYAFQGLGEPGLEILATISAEFGLPVVTEAVDETSLLLVDQYADCIQIGARNMQNFELLKAAGRARHPVLLKRGMSATLEELLLSAEYIMAHGNANVILCERGIRTFSDHARNTLDISAIPALRQLTHLPIIVDPSHATGKREQILPMSLAAVAAGADGLLIEVHHRPEEALCDGPQATSPVALKRIVRESREIARIYKRVV